MDIELSKLKEDEFLEELEKYLDGELEEGVLWDARQIIEKVKDEIERRMECG